MSWRGDSQFMLKWLMAGKVQVLVSVGVFPIRCKIVNHHRGGRSKVSNMAMEL